MATIGKLGVSVGQVTYYVPSPAKGVSQKDRSPDDKLRGRAQWAIPAELAKCCAHLDGSNWYFNTSFYEKVKAVADAFDGKAGINFYIVEEFTPKDPSVIARIVNDSLRKTINAIIPSLEASVNELIVKFDSMNLEDGDGKIVDVYRENKKKLEQVSAVIASFGLIGDYQDIQTIVSQSLEAQLVRARTELGKRMMAQQEGVK